MFIKIHIVVHHVNKYVWVDDGSANAVTGAFRQQTIFFFLKHSNVVKIDHVSTQSESPSMHTTLFNNVEI